MAETQTKEWKELDYREADGGNLGVRIKWLDAQPPEVIVEVNDLNSKESFYVRVLEGQNAWDVFMHPFAYAASRAVEQTTQLDIHPDAIYSD